MTQAQFRYFKRKVPDIDTRSLRFPELALDLAGTLKGHALRAGLKGAPDALPVDTDIKPVEGAVLPNQRLPRQDFRRTNVEEGVAANDVTYPIQIVLADIQRRSL